MMDRFIFKSFEINVCWSCFFKTYLRVCENFATAVWYRQNYFNVMSNPLKRGFDFLLGESPLCLDYRTSFAGRLHGFHRNVQAGFGDSKRIRASACFQMGRDWSGGSRAKCSACYTFIRDRMARHIRGTAVV